MVNEIKSYGGDAPYKEIMVNDALPKIYNNCTLRTDIPTATTSEWDFLWTATTTDGQEVKCCGELKTRFYKKNWTGEKELINKDTYGGENQKGWMFEINKEENLKTMKERYGNDNGYFFNYTASDGYLRVWDMKTMHFEKGISHQNISTVEPEKGQADIEKIFVWNKDCIWEGYV